MAYNAFSVTNGELVASTKWNNLGGNDDFFNTQVGANFASTSSTVWWEELGRTTLSATGDTIASPTFTARKFLRLYIYIVNTSTVDILATFNGDTGSNYSFRSTSNGAADGTTTSNANIALTGTTSYTRTQFLFVDIFNLSTASKLVISKHMELGLAGAGTQPNRQEVVGKWVNTSAQITSITLTNSQSGSYDIGSSITVLGHD